MVLAVDAGAAGPPSDRRNREQSMVSSDTSHTELLTTMWGVGLPVLSRRWGGARGRGRLADGPPSTKPAGRWLLGPSLALDTEAWIADLTLADAALASLGPPLSPLPSR